MKYKSVAHISFIFNISIYIFDFYIKQCHEKFFKYHLEYDKLGLSIIPVVKNVHTQYQYIGCLFQARKMVFEFQISILWLAGGEERINIHCEKQMGQVMM